MINFRGALIVFMSTVALVAASAHAKGTKDTPFCQMLRNAVKTYGEAQVEQMARSTGATDAQIKEAMKCLQSK